MFSVTQRLDLRERNLGSARASRAGDGALAIANFHSQNIAARRRNEHARRVRSPENQRDCFMYWRGQTSASTNGTYVFLIPITITASLAAARSNANRGYSCCRRKEFLADAC